MNVSQAIVKILEDNGVDTLFAGSGQSDADALFALAESKKMRTVIVRNEQGASFMACGYAMFSDKLGVCMTTAGPGAINTLSGLAVAYSDSLPVLAITGYATKEMIGKGDLGETSGLNRTPDSQAMFSATTKKSFILDRPDRVCDVMEEALNLAFEGRPGPINLHLPYDVSAEEVPNYRPVKVHVEQVLPHAKTIQQFANTIADAIAQRRQVVAWLGYGCIRSHAEQDVLKFLEQFQIPFATTMDAKGMLPEDHPLSLGMLGVSGDPGAIRGFAAADVVLAIGNSFAKWSTWKSRANLFDNKTLLQINIDKQANGRVYPADCFMLSDVRPAIIGLTEALARKVPAVKKVTPKVEKFADQRIEYTGTRIHPAQLVQEMTKLLPERAIVLGDAGSHMLWLACYMRLTKGQNYQNPGCFGPMASHVNGAIGVRCANPNRHVIAAVGDGDYQMAGFELMTAVQNKIPVIWVIFNNGEFNIIKFMQMRTQNGQHVFNDILNPDYKAFAEACGATGYRVERLNEFGAAFKDALSRKVPAIIDVHVETDVYPPFEKYDDALKRLGLTVNV